MSLQNAILGILTYSPMTGYYLGKIFDQSINYSWTASLSQIYRELGALEKKGFVTSSIQQQDDRPDKKIYSMTEEGQKAFNEWMNDFPETFSSPKRDEFMLRIFFGSKVGKKELIKQFRKFIKDREVFNNVMAEGEDRIIELSKIMKKGTAEPSMESDELYWRFIVKRAVMTNKVLMEWAEECIKELEKSDL